MEYKEIEMIDFDGNVNIVLVVEYADGTSKSFAKDETNSEYVAFLESIKNK